MSMQERLRDLVERHHVNLVEQIATVGRLLTPPEDGSPLPLPRIIEAQGITHQMKGTAGSMGFPDVGAAAATLDESLKSLEKGPGPIAPGQLQAALDLMSTLCSIAAATTPEMSTLYNADLSKLAK